MTTRGRKEGPGEIYCKRPTHLVMCLILVLPVPVSVISLAQPFQLATWNFLENTKHNLEEIFDFLVQKSHTFKTPHCRP